MDYKKLGLICGLEIHQQLDIGKLFCSCPTDLREDAPQFQVQRYLRAVSGESGEVDIAAQHEMLKGKKFVYEGHKDTTCLVELDEEPPHPVNSEALKVALEVALLLKTDVFDVVQVMRKMVVDGSNTSGFQRTALIAHRGKFGTKEGNVRVATICLEEDSARIVKEEQGLVVYRLDRLGIPLIEIGTGPDIHTPQQCLEAAEKLGMILRSTGKVKRGIGTIRQDVNVSIAGGARVEIKGAQELRLLPLLVENEAHRQMKLLETRDELKRRNAGGSKASVNVSDEFDTTQSQVIQKMLTKGGVVLGMTLPGFHGVIGKELQPGRRLGTEFSDHVKVRAGVHGIFHSDELPAYGISQEEVARVKKKLGCTEKDAFVLVAEEQGKAQKAIEAVAERARQALRSVPEEVRRANPDGTTSYLRPMPGAARMYPETDIPLIVPDVRKIKLPELIDAKIGRFMKLGLSGDLAEFVAKSDRVFLFEELVKKHHSVKASFIAELVTAKLLELKRDYQMDPEAVTDDVLRQVVGLVADGKLAKELVLKALIDMVKKTFNLSAYKALGRGDLKKEVIAIVNENPGLQFGALMGIVMKKLQGKASGKEISEILKEGMKKK